MASDDARENQGGQQGEPSGDEPEAAETQTPSRSDQDPPSSTKEEAARSSGAWPVSPQSESESEEDAEDAEDAEAFEHAAEAPTAVWSSAFSELEEEEAPPATAPVGGGGPRDSIEIDQSLSGVAGPSARSERRPKNRGSAQSKLKPALSWLGVILFALACGVGAYFAVRLFL